MSIKEVIKKYNNLFSVVIITAIYDKINLLAGKYILKKNNRFNNVIILDPPPIISKYNEKDIRKQESFSEEQVTNFVSKMKTKIPEENLKIMYNNLHRLRIKESDIMLILLTFAIRPFIGKGIVGGGYIPKTNKIITYSPKGDELLYKLFKRHNESLELEYFHELLHMSSTVKRFNKICSGFNHIYIASYMSFSIGRGINEGYTDLLNDKLFNFKNDGGLYSIYKSISSIVENVIGNEKMMKYYFSANLNGLIYELAKYSNHGEAKKFIINMDMMHNNSKVMPEIIEYLNIIQTNKLKQEQGTNKVESYKEFKQKISDLVNMINELNTLNKKKKNKDIQKYLEENNTQHLK